MSSVSLKKRWMDLLHATLETWAHQILYQRHVYPANSFAPTRFFGVRCHANRHPDVVRYIQDSVAVAVQSLIAGTADHVNLAITDQRNGMERELERYTIELSVIAIPEWEQPAKKIDVERLERAMRDLILKVHAVDSGRVSSSDTLSFKILVYCIAGDNLGRTGNALADGTFFAHSESTERSVAGNADRFLWDDINTGLYTLRFSMKRHGQA